MNIFRLAGDLSHILAIILLVIKVWKTRSCAGLSGKSQIMFALVFCTRYLDLFTNFISLYNTTMKTIFITASLATVYLMYFKFRATYDSNHDTFRMEFLIVPVAGLSFLVNHDFSPLEVFWSFSVFLEAVALLPQLWMISFMDKITRLENPGIDSLLLQYATAMTFYKGFYLVNWVYRLRKENFIDLIAVAAGIVQTLVSGSTILCVWVSGHFTDILV